MGDFKVGNWISALPACYSCGECEYCKKGLVTLMNMEVPLSDWKEGFDAAIGRRKYKIALLPDTTFDEK